MEYNTAVRPTALLLPADGSSVRLVNYSLIHPEAEENNPEAFQEELPGLRPWFGNSFRERAIYDFTADGGNYSLYYTLSPLLPANETCKRILNVELDEGRLFWKGDVLVVRWEGEDLVAERY